MSPLPNTSISYIGGAEWLRLRPWISDQLGFGVIQSFQIVIISWTILSEDFRFKDLAFDYFELM